MDDASIERMVESMEAETKDIKDEIYRICWGMRGGVTEHALFHTLSHEDRAIMNKIIVENIETMKKTGYSVV